jgi:hypothetical protein
MYAALLPRIIASSRYFAKLPRVPFIDMNKVFLSNLI